MKKLINDVDHVVDDMLEGMIKAYPNKIKKLDIGNIIVEKMLQ